jgi:hypothetical protein
MNRSVSQSVSQLTEGKHNTLNEIAIICIFVSMEWNTQLEANRKAVNHILSITKLLFLVSNLFLTNFLAVFQLIKI